MKISFNFLNRWEHSIFDNSPDKEFVPVSAFMARTVLIAAFVMLAAFFVIMALNNGSDKDVIVAAAVIFGVALLIVAGKVYRNFEALPSAGTKVWYIAYILALFVVCACLFTWLSTGLIMIYILWIVIKAMLGGGKNNTSFGSSGPGKRGVGQCDGCYYYPGGGQYCSRVDQTVYSYTSACNEYIKND